MTCHCAVLVFQLPIHEPPQCTGCGSNEVVSVVACDVNGLRHPPPSPAIPIPTPDCALPRRFTPPHVACLQWPDISSAKLFTTLRNAVHCRSMLEMSGSEPMRGGEMEGIEEGGGMGGTSSQHWTLSGEAKIPPKATIYVEILQWP